MANKAPWSRIAPVGPMYRMDLYSSTVASGTTGGLVGTMSSGLFSVRWASTSKIFQLTTLEVDYMLAIAPATGATYGLGLYFIRNYSAIGTGPAATFGTGTYPTQALDTLFGPSEFATNGSGVGNIAYASTTVLGTGTGVIDPSPMRSFMGYPTVLAIGATPQNSFVWDIGNDQNTTALFCRYNEGFQIQGLFTSPATASLIIHVGMEWIEMPANRI